MDINNIINKINRLNVDTLSVWDIDDTLFLSPKTHVYVTKGGQIVKKLTTEQFNKYHLGSGEKFDFYEFKDAKLFFNTAQPLSANLRTAKQALEHKNTFVLVLTARSDFNDKKKFLEKFKMYGLDMSKPNIHVVRSGNFGMGTAAGKKEVLKTIFDKCKFKNAAMYDDDTKNLDAFLSIKPKDVKMSAFAVKKGKIQPY